MEIEKIQMSKEKAKVEWKNYSQLLKKRHEKYLEEMKKCMYQLSQGKDLIDVYKIMEKAGVNKSYQPKLAIGRADWKEVYFIKKDSGRGFFTGSDTGWPTKSDGHIDLQPQTFMDWPRELGDDGKPMSGEWAIANYKVKTKTPIIPATLMPEGNLKEYYILWEVQRWEDVPEQKDPLLLKRITENLFVILSAWEVTALEQSIISAR